MNKLVCIIIFIVSSSLCFAEEATCTGSWVNPITDVCWSCLFPITLGSASLVSSSLPDTDNPSNPICSCGSPFPRVGLSIGFWEPIALVDIVRRPYCMTNLGGMTLPLGSSLGGGTNETAQNVDTHSFYYVHWYFYPLLNWLGLIDDIACAQKGDLDIAYFAELDPTWRDDELHFILEPEAILFGNPIAQAACIADSIATYMNKLPIDKLFWCAGSQGSIYPLTGWVQEHVSGVQASTLLAERTAFKLHRMWMLWDSDPDDVCTTFPRPIMPKSRYRYQMVNPIATTGDKGCHQFGAPTPPWESNIEYPGTREDFGHLIWRKRNCCLL